MGMRFAYLLTMNTHKSLIERNGGWYNTAKILNLPNKKAARDWWRRNSIPSNYWGMFCAANLATLEELAQAVAKDPIS